MTLSRMTRRALLATGAALTAAFAFAGASVAADFPDRQITMVVPFAAGGSTDVVARIIAQKMSEDLGSR